MIELAFHPDALSELKAEVAYYELVEPGLGAVFADEIFRMVGMARLFPRMGSTEEGEIRSLLTKRFPFLIYYEVVGETLWIWAVMHAAREPGYWKDRRRVPPSIDSPVLN